jgi:hypothetical protein
MSSEPGDTVILGAGIIGLCTAYYLSQSGHTKPESIHLVDSSERLLHCASGFAGGFLAADCMFDHHVRAFLVVNSNIIRRKLTLCRVRAIQCLPRRTLIHFTQVTCRKARRSEDLGLLLEYELLAQSGQRGGRGGKRRGLAGVRQESGRDYGVEGGRAERGIAPKVVKESGGGELGDD